MLTNPIKFHFSPDLLRNYCIDLFFKVGVPRDEAFYVADSLVAANLCGVESHGVSRMPIYIERLENGLVAKQAQYTVVKERTATLMIDAENSMGAVVCAKIMQIAIEKAKKAGVALVTVKNSNHFGMASYFASMALEHSFIGFATTNAPSTMAPFGGMAPYFGTNPIACAVPSSKVPIIMDMASSVVARGKIILAARNGQDIPLGWAITDEGEPTTNAQKALDGTVLPFAGPKGYAIAMMVDIFSGILSGGVFGTQINNLYDNVETTQQVGHFLTVIDPDCFVGRQEFICQVDEMIQQVKNAPRAKNVNEIFIPGELEYIKKKQREKDGLPLSISEVNDLIALGNRLNVPFISDLSEC